MTRAAIYARVSTTKEAQATSPENQIASCRAHCARQDWEIVAVEQDRSTGRNMNREGWQRMLNLVASRAVDVVVVTHRDRVSRNRRDFEDVRASHFEPYSVRLVPLMGIEVNPEIIQTRWMEEDEITQAQRFSEMLSWKTRTGRRRRLEDGYWPTQPPYGCMADPQQKGVPVKDPDTWPVVVSMFELAALGATYGKVLRTLDAQGSRAKRGGRWGLTSVCRVLQNPFYIGEFWQDGEVFKLRHECVIERELWKAAQGEDRPGSKGGRPRNVEGYIYLVPRVVCSHYEITAPKRRAGEPLPLYARYATGRGGVRNYYYYRADRLRASGGVEAESVDGVPLRGKTSLRAAISAPELDRCVVEWFLTHCHDDELFLVNLQEPMDQQAERLTKQRRRLSRQLANLKSSITKLEGKVSDDLLIDLGADAGSEILRAVGNRLGRDREQCREIQQELERVEQQQLMLADRKATGENTLEQAHAIEVLWKAGDYLALREVLAMVVDRVDLRLDTPRIYLTPVMIAPASMRTRLKAAPTGVEPVFPP